MNERIRELMPEPAMVLDSAIPLPVYSEEQFEKFAELIVRECGQIAYSEENDYGNKIRFMILEHFGVEE